MRVECDCGSGLPVYASFAYPGCKLCQRRCLGDAVRVPQRWADTQGSVYGQRIGMSKVAGGGHKGR